MSVIESKLDTHSEAFKANAAAMQELVDQFRGIERQVIDTAEKKTDRKSVV